MYMYTHDVHTCKLLRSFMLSLSHGVSVVTIDQMVLIKAVLLRCPRFICLGKLPFLSHAIVPSHLLPYISTNYLTYPRIACWSSVGSTVKSPVSVERPDVGRVIIACGTATA